MRLRPGGPRLSPRRDEPAYAFTAPRGLPPKDSRACCTPWSVFQDGSDAAIRTPTTSARVVAPPRPEGPRPSPDTASSEPERETSRRGAAADPEVGPRRSVRRTATLSSVAPELPRAGLYGLRASAKPPPRTPAEPKATAVGRHLAEVQGRRESPRRDQRSQEGFRGPPGPRAGTLSPTRRRFSCIRFPPNGFAVFLTLFSKYFSPFPHGTCSLSVSCQYLALDGVYHPLWAAFPNNPTLRRQWQPGPAASLTGLSPSLTRLSRSTSTAPTRDKGCLSRPQFSDARRRGFQARAVPTSLAVTEGILVSFFSSAY